MTSIIERLEEKLWDKFFEELTPEDLNFLSDAFVAAREEIEKFDDYINKHAGPCCAAMVEGLKEYCAYHTLVRKLIGGDKEKK